LSTIIVVLSSECGMSSPSGNLRHSAGASQQVDAFHANNPEPACRVAR